VVLEEQIVDGVQIAIGRCRSRLEQERSEQEDHASLCRGSRPGFAQRWTLQAS
jgi:hypothetical protein